MDKLYSLRELANALQIHIKTAQRYCREGRIPKAYKIGRVWKIPGETINKIVAGDYIV